MERYNPTWWEKSLRCLGKTNLPGVHRLINRVAPIHSTQTVVRTKLYDLDYDADISDFIDRSIFYYGSYAPEELEFLRDAARGLREVRGRVNFIDVGANCGQHSLFMAGLASTVQAFEPSRPISERFRRNISLNGIDNITLHEIALGNRDAELALGSGFPGNSGSRSLQWSLPGQNLELVKVRDAEVYFQDHALPPIDLMKLDCEGYEKVVLGNLRERLARDRPIILMEFINAAEFTDIQDLSDILYPDHHLRSLVYRPRRYELRRFEWEREALVVVPNELVAPVGLQVSD